MIATVEQVFERSRAHLGDVDGEIFDNTMLLPFFQTAYEEMYSKMDNMGLSAVEATAFYTLPAGTASLTPATAGILNFGELMADGLGERLNGTTDKYIPLTEQSDLSQWDPSDRLRYFEWSGEAFKFIAATTARDLRIRYFASATAPSTGTLGIDDAQNFLAARTAALAAATRDMTTDSQRLDLDARGPKLDGNGGYLYVLCNSMLLAAQRTTSVRPRFRPQSRFRREIYGYPYY